MSKTPMKFTLIYFTCNFKQCKNILIQISLFRIYGGVEGQTRLYLFFKIISYLFGRITYRRVQYVFTQNSTSNCLDILQCSFCMTNNSFVGRIRINSVWTIQLFVWTKLVLFGRISFLFGRITFFWRRERKRSDSNEKSL